MGPPRASQIDTPEIETGFYTEQFAAVLAEHSALAPILMPVGSGRSMRARRGLLSDDARHLPALKAAALGWLLLLGGGAATWYAIVSPMQRTPMIVRDLAATSANTRAINTPYSWLIESGSLLVGAVRAALAADEWVVETEKPIFPEPAEMDVETAAVSTPNAVPPSQMTHSQATDFVASDVEPSVPPSTPQLPKDVIGSRLGDAQQRPHTVPDSGGKGAFGNPFVDLYSERPQRALGDISTASRVSDAGGGSQPDVKQSKKNAKSDKGVAKSHTAPQDSHPHDARSDSSPGKKDGKSGKSGPGSDGPANAGPKAGGHADPGGRASAGLSADKSASGGPQHSHKSNDSESGRKDADKKDKRGSGK
jgi:hypothetical protein